MSWGQSEGTRWNSNTNHGTVREGKKRRKERENFPVKSSNLRHCLRNRYAGQEATVRTGHEHQTGSQFHPTVSLSHQEASISLLSSVRAKTDCKPQSEKTNQTDNMDHNFVYVNETMSHDIWGHPRWMGHGGEFGQNVVHWRREWQTTSVFLPWELHEQYEKFNMVNIKLEEHAEF